MLGEALALNHINRKLYVNQGQVNMTLQIKSKKRVVDHGEVFTSEKEVNAMLDFVKPETERIESRFLEPACGTGNFLIEILHRKLNIVEQRYKKVSVNMSSMLCLQYPLSMVLIFWKTISFIAATACSNTSMSAIQACMAKIVVKNVGALYALSLNLI